MLRDLVRAWDLLGAGFDVETGSERLAQSSHAPARSHLSFEDGDGVSESLEFVGCTQSGKAATDHDDALSGSSTGEPFNLPGWNSRSDRGQERATAHHRAAYDTATAAA